MSGGWGATGTADNPGNIGDVGFGGMGGIGDMAGNLAGQVSGMNGGWGATATTGNPGNIGQASFGGGAFNGQAQGFQGGRNGYYNPNPQTQQPQADPAQSPISPWLARILGTDTTQAPSGTEPSEWLQRWLGAQQTPQQVRQGLMGQFDQLFPRRAPAQPFIQQDHGL